ncbi:hypothetical protein [Nocardiopsis baichengensis]|uniref:hypothetical protein n=1 Tax=Nocardiopsis baichengensis TaxID=280240 RepID=UPI00034BDB01|nr:hypothetical protein [Nocardiopsis baichengensis]
MTVSYSAPRLEEGQYTRFVELALNHTRWGIGYTSDGELLLFTAAHSRHDVGIACRDLEDLATLLAAADGSLVRLPPPGRRPHAPTARELRHRAQEARDLLALMTPTSLRDHTPPPRSAPRGGGSPTAR